MGIRERYAAYAEAFEMSYNDDDWSRLEQYFTDGAVYEGDPVARGRAAVIARFKNGVDNFDRRMDSRQLTLEEAKVNGNTVTVRWESTYTKKGLPDLTITGSEFATFDGDRISNLRDEFDPKAQKTMNDWMQQHGKALQG